jgi:CubicO group peptidase (beta-lactamase class C family)
MDEAFAVAREKIAATVEVGTGSIAVAVARAGEVVWEEGFGTADAAAGRKADAHTPYSLASITKPMTATALMRLVERDQIDLARPIGEYLGAGEITARLGCAEDVTVEHVLNHTAGLPTHYQFFYEDEPARPPRFEETLGRYAYCSRAPGEGFEYSNLGYGVLDHVIERVSGGSYGEFMRTEVFEPLGMGSSAIGPVEGCAVRYSPSGDPIPDYEVDHPGASMAYASAADLVRFGLFHLGRRQDEQQQILRPDTLARMRQGDAVREPGLRYALGWQIAEPTDGPTIVSHGGGMPGVTTQLALLPESDAAIALLCNRTPSLLASVLAPIQDALVTALLGKDSPPPLRPENPLTMERGSFVPPADFVGSWRGAVHTCEGPRDVGMHLAAAGEVRLDLAGDRGLEPVLSFTEGDAMVLAFPGATVETGDTARGANPVLNLILRRREDRLVGQALARDTSARMRFALSHWIDLQRC